MKFKKVISNIKCFLLDMDGTIYLGNNLIDGAKDFLKAVEDSGKEYYFFTNNSSKSALDYQAKLDRLGIKVSKNRIITSGEVTAEYILKQKKEPTVYLVGTPSLEKEFKKREISLVKDKTKDIDYLVLGFDTTINYEKLWAAHDLILNGVEYIATNPDYVCPLEGAKTMPDCGSFISLLETSTGKKPKVIGKPNTLMIDYVVDKTGIKKEQLAMIGDRLYTDIQTAINANITSILTLSGETSYDNLNNAEQNPDFIIESIKDLAEMIIQQQS